MNRNGFTIVELTIASAIMSLVILQTAGIATFYSKQNQESLKSADAYGDLSNLKRFLDKIDICTANFQNKNHLNKINIDKIYGTKPSGSIDTSNIFFDNSKLGYNTFIDSANNQLGTSSIKTKLLTLKYSTTNQKSINLFYTLKPGTNNIDKCSTRGVDGLMDITPVLSCSPENQGQVKFDFTEKQTLVCDNGEWKAHLKTGGVFTTMIHQNLCRHKNPITKNCTCPKDFTEKLTYSFHNLNCKNDANTTYYDEEQKKEILMPIGTCGTKTFTCVKN